MHTSHPEVPCTWLTRQEAANYIKVHLTTLGGYIKTGKVKVSRPSKKVIRICLEDLRDFMEGK